ncbi:single-stranded DNA-binding protein, partial [Bacteroides thetaiotaomicron]
IEGRFQSRKYTKVFDGESVEKTAYEISVMKLEQAGEEGKPSA